MIRPPSTPLCLWSLSLALLAGGVTRADEVNEHQQQLDRHRLATLKSVAAILQQVGEGELANEAQRRAEMLESELDAQRSRLRAQDARERSLAKTREQEDNQLREVNKMIQQLREQVQRLQKEVIELREQIDQQREREEDRRLGDVDLSGQWEMTLPAGWKHQVTIRPQERGLLSFETKALNLKGAYQHDGSRLRIELPSQERMHGLVWKLKSDDTLVLVAGPDYVGATLVRLAEESETSQDANQPTTHRAK